MAAPPITERHKPHFHRNTPVRESVRAASTASGTLASAFENGDSLDGVTLATGDRILLKDQSTGSQNGIYTVNASGAPTRSYDVSTDDPGLGWLVYVREGTANGGRIFRCTNTSTPTIGSTAQTFAQVVASSSLSIFDEGGALATAADALDFVGAGVAASGTGATKTITIPGGSTGSDTYIWRPLMDGAGNVVTDSGTGEAIMAFGPV